MTTAAPRWLASPDAAPRPWDDAIDGRKESATRFCRYYVQQPIEVEKRLLCAGLEGTWAPCAHFAACAALPPAERAYLVPAYLTRL